MNLRVESALLPVLDLLSEFRVVIFKGPSLTRQIYGDLRKRVSGDNDLWISGPDCHRALDVLLGEGFRPLSTLEPHAALEQAGQVALWPNGDEREVSLDLHAFPFSRTYFSVAPALLESFLESCESHGRDFTVFNRPLALCHMVAHFVQHHFEEAHLESLGAAWDAWHALLPETGWRELIDGTCGRAAFEFTLNQVKSQGYCAQDAPVLQNHRARLVTLILGAQGGRGPVVLSRALSLFLSNRSGMVLSAWRALFLGRNQLYSRYGKGSVLQLHLRRLIHLLRQR